MFLTCYRVSSSGHVFAHYTAPAKPNKPTVEGTAVDEVRVTYNFGLGGGYTHEFLVMYRKKGKSKICLQSPNDVNIELKLNYHYV